MTTDKLQAYVEMIQGLGVELDRVSAAFRQNLGTAEYKFDRYSSDDWRRAVYGDSLVRLRQLTENNFRIIETLSLLAVSRYVFETSVWLNLFKKDSRYCLVYYIELLRAHRRFQEDSKANAEREISLLRELEGEDSRGAAELVRATRIGGIAASKVGRRAKEAMDRVDVMASRQFAVFFDDAKHNGYGYKAYLVETQVVKRIGDSLTALDEERRALEACVPMDTVKLAPKRWEWRKMSTLAGLGHEHDYIYSYASKLLHATPYSITTDHKNLEPEEVVVFLRYVYVKLHDVLDLAYEQPECAIHGAP